MESLKDALEAAANQVQRQRSQKEALILNLEDLSKSMQAEEKIASVADKAAAVVQQLIARYKELTTGKIEGMVSLGLRTVFENPEYTFSVEETHTKRGSTYSFSLSDGSYGATDILASKGGGIVNVVSFLLAVFIQLSCNRTGRMILLDERFNNVSPKYRPLIADLLSQLAKRANVQFFLVSHQDSVHGDLEYEVSRTEKGTVLV